MQYKKSAFLICLIFLLVIIADQLTKFVVISSKLVPVYFNKTIAFSLPIPWFMPWLVIGGIAAYMFFFSSRSFSHLKQYSWVFHDRILSIALPLIAGGGISNIIDRLLHNGMVVDFIDLRYWPVFNLADSAIVIGVALIIYHLYTTRGANYGQS